MRPFLNRSRSFQRGSTVFETMLVIAVIAGLMGTIGVCVASYQQGAGRSECIRQITAVQWAVRGYQQDHSLSPGDPIPSKSLIGSGLVFEMRPCCPISGEAYEWENRFPVSGRAIVRCPHASGRGHAPSLTTGW